MGENNKFEKSMFTPGLVSKMTLKLDDNSMVDYKRLNGYKIESEIDRKLLFGIWDEGRENG